MTTIQYTEALQMQTVHCADCGVIFALTTKMESKLREDGRFFYCPNGHSLHFNSRIKELERKLSAKEAELSMAQSRLLVARQEREVMEAKHARLQRRITQGVCPCCKRTFKQLAEHMKRKHPGMVKAQS